MALTQQTMQHVRRLGTPGPPPTLLPGQFAINDPGDGVTLARLYGGVAMSALNPTDVAVLVSNQRQVELSGEQTIIGDKTIDVSRIHILGGSHGDALVTDGFGNLFWVAGGGGVFPEAPTDGQVYGRDGLTQSWDPVLPLTGGTVTGNLFVDGTLEINGSAVVGDAPIDGHLYVRGNASWVLLPWQWPDGSGGGTGGGIPEAPPTGIVYGRNGQSQSWTPVLPLSGGTMLGTLVLNGPPVPGGNPNQAATMGYVNGLITGALQFIGTMDASVTPNQVTYTLSSGLPTGPLVPPSTVPDRYVIVSEEGVLNAPSYLAGQTVSPGDWIISDGSAWNIVRIGATAAPVFASDVVVTPPIAGQDNVQSVLTTLLTQIGENAFPEAPTDGQLYGRNGMAQSWQTVLPLAGGTMLGNLILDGPPTSQSPPNQAATRAYVDGLITGALEFLGTMDASASQVTYTVSSGITPNPGPLVPASQAADQYVIVSVPGTIAAGAPAAAGGATVQAGDWLISDGVSWQVINVSAATVLATNVTVGPAVMGQTDVQGALTALASAVGQLQSQVASFLTSVSTIGDVYSAGTAGP